jgi:peptide deformylase
VLAPVLLLCTSCAATMSQTPDQKPSLPPIVQIGHPVLRQRATDVPPEKLGTAELKTLVANMIQVMRAAPGVGLAAPQIGVPWRIFVLEDRDELISKIGELERTERERVAFGPRVFINPVVRPVGEARATFFEGCLSVAGFVGLVERALEVEVQGLDEHGAPQTWRVRGWPARILQHEHDHIEGTVYVDRMLRRSFMTGEHMKARFSGQPIEAIKRAFVGSETADR